MSDFAQSPPPAPTYLLTIGLTAPITSTFALPLSAYYLFLQARVIHYRFKTNTILSTTSKSSSSPPAQPDEPQADRPDALEAAYRSQANFAENVPLALLLAGLVEINGGSKKVLIGALGALTVARVAHAEFGLMDFRKDERGRRSVGIGRPVGFYGTVAVIAGMAGYGAWLGRGVWGLGR